jgi:hypothetical protein
MNYEDTIIEVMTLQSVVLFAMLLITCKDVISKVMSLQFSYFIGKVVIINVRMYQV